MTQVRFRTSSAQLSSSSSALSLVKIVLILSFMYIIFTKIIYKYKNCFCPSFPGIFLLLRPFWPISADGQLSNFLLPSAHRIVQHRGGPRRSFCFCKSLGLNWSPNTFSAKNSLPPTFVAPFFSENLRLALCCWWPPRRWAACSFA